MLRVSDIILRAVELADKNYIYQWENDTDNWPITYTSKPFSSHTIEAYLREDTYDIYTTKQLRLMLVLKDGTVLGCVDLFDFDPRNMRAGVGILIDKQYRKQGRASEALGLLKQYAFNTLFLNQLYAYIDDHNHGSIKLFENNGFKKSVVLKQWNKKENKVFNDVFVFQCINDL
jgi:diamine N-acetyltransferase